MTSEEEFNLDEPLFTISEVAEKLKVSDHTVRSWIQERWLRIIKVGRGVSVRILLIRMGGWESITAGMMTWAVVGLLILVMLSGCAGQDRSPKENGRISVSSAAFVHGGLMPVRYTCLGDDISPSVRWERTPIGTQSFAVIVEDLDAPGGIFTHWLVYGIPANQSELSEGLPKEKEVAGGIRQGNNSFGTAGYRGPCPPVGSSHRYILRVYALDGMMNLAGGADRKTFDAAIKGHVLDSVETGVLFGR